MDLTRRNFLKSSALLVGNHLASEPMLAETGERSGFVRTGEQGMRMVHPRAIFTVADTPGIYHHSAGIVSTPGGLVCVYRTSDQHLASWVNINVARSTDGGRTWKDHRVLAESSFEKDRANWVAPQTSRMPDGRIVVIVDRGVKKSPFDWPMLSDWQKPDRGMSNHLFESRDGGVSWLPARKIDDVGGEPSYVVGLSDGTLVYTRTDSVPTTAKKAPAMPWGPNYYKSTAVFSDNGGKTFARTAPVFDDPLIGDCEVGLVEYAPGKLLALSRVGDGGSGPGQPSRVAFSEDFGKTWSKPQLAPVYAHRPCLGKLADGRLFMTFRNGSSGTSGTLARVFSLEETPGYHPNNFIWDESCCLLERDGYRAGIPTGSGLHLRTGEGTRKGVEFILYPMEDDDSSCEIEATLAVHDADTHGCLISAGAWVRFTPTRVCLADRPADGFDLDATAFHTYRLVNEGHRLKVFVDGALRLDVPTEGVFTRQVRFGNRRGATPPRRHEEGTPFPPDGGGYTRNRAHSVWKSFRVNVKNRRDHSVTWAWQSASGKYPDQYRRDNLILLERNGSLASGNNGYSGWAQQPDGSLVVADYTCTEKNLTVPILRAYRLNPNEF